MSNYLDIQFGQSGKAYCVYDPTLIDPPSPEHFSHTHWENNQAVIGREKGRGTTLFVRHNNHEWVLRHYLRGGLVSKFNKEKYWFSNWERCRSVAEFHVLQTLADKGLPVPKPVAAQATRTSLMYQADILIEKIPGAEDFIQVLKTKQPEAFYQQLAQCIALFHKNGVYHADLNIQNILQDQHSKFWLIDFDRAQINPDKINWQSETISRLHRSFAKEKLRHNICWDESDWQVFEAAYQQAMQ